jgi:hypothetical protein
MPFVPSESDELRKRALLLREVVELLIEELAALSNNQWEDLPDLKKEKVILAGRLQAFNRASEPTEEPSDFGTLESLIADLEDQSRQKIEFQLDLIGKQILALQELHQYWRECLSVSFQKFYGSMPSQ